MKLINTDDIRYQMLYKENFLSGTGVEAQAVWKSDIDAMPAVDAVPVVRCKDCRWGRETCGNIECFVDLNAPTEYHGYNWFCPNGERKDDGMDC